MDGFRGWVPGGVDRQMDGWVGIGVAGWMNASLNGLSCAKEGGLGSEEVWVCVA